MLPAHNNTLTASPVKTPHIYIQKAASKNECLEKKSAQDQTTTTLCPPLPLLQVPPSSGLEVQSLGGRLPFVV